MFVLQIIVIF